MVEKQGEDSSLGNYSLQPTRLKKKNCNIAY